MHQEHLQRSIASGTRCKRRRRFRTAAAIKLPVLQLKYQQYTPWATRVLQEFQSAPPSAHCDDKLPQLSASGQWYLFLRCNECRTVVLSCDDVWTKKKKRNDEGVLLHSDC